MSVRYYPKFYIIENLQTTEQEFVNKQGTLYVGKYYATMNGRYFTGPNPEIGPNEEIFAIKNYTNTNDPVGSSLDIVTRKVIYDNPKSFYEVEKNLTGKPTFYYPKPTEQDYTRGYIIRYFTKKENEYGNIIEITENEYNQIVNGTAHYDISIYQTGKILWKLTGPLRSQRKSQYNVIPGIIDTNQRLTEEMNKTLFGLVEFIGGEYDKFARPTP